MRCERGNNNDSNTLERTHCIHFRPDISTIIYPSPPPVNRIPHINSSSSCYRASLLFSYSLSPPAFCDLVAAFTGSRLLLLSAVSLQTDFWSTSEPPASRPSRKCPHTKTSPHRFSENNFFTCCRITRSPRYGVQPHGRPRCFPLLTTEG